MSTENKQFVAVSIFLLVIVLGIATLVTQSVSNKKKKEYTVTPITMNDDEIIPEVEDSKPIEVVTSNKNAPVTTNNNNSTNHTATNTSNKTNSSTSTSTSVPISYFITKVDNNVIYTGGTTNIHVTIMPENASASKITYSSSNKAIAMVTEYGKVIGVNAGKCTIYVNVEGGGTSSFEIQVIKLPSHVSTSNTNKKTTSSSNKTNSTTNKSNTTTNSTSNKSNTNSTSNKSNTNTNSNSNSNPIVKVRVLAVSLNKTSLNLKVGETYKLSATVAPSNAANKSVTWTSSNTGAATVSQSGVVTAKKAGTTTITVTTKDNSKKATCTVTVTAPKNGWYTEGGKKYYYKNDVKQKNQFVEYVYLGSDGAALNKMGPFEITIYKSTAWVAVEPLNIRQTASSSAKKLGQVPVGAKVTLLSAETNGYIKMEYNGITGYILANEIFINLPDIIPGIYYNIVAASPEGGQYTVAGKKIPGITGVKLYQFSKKFNSKINRSEYYAPLLYPVAKKLYNAYVTAKKQGYSFKIYDTYRPRPVETKIYNAYQPLFNDPVVNAAINKVINGFQYNWSWFMTSGASKHCQGIALDLALTDKNGKELPAQTKVGTLDTSSVVEYNNANSNKLRSIMTGAGLFSLKSEWWHFDDRNNTQFNGFINNPYASFYIYN